MSREHLQEIASLVKEKEPRILWYRSLKYVKEDQPEDTELGEDDPCLGNFDPEKCSKMMWTLNQARKNHTAPFEIPGTRGQRNNPVWRGERAIRATASSCKRMLGLSKESAKIDFCRSHIWGLNFVMTYAMRYGIEHEDEARQAYLTKIQLVDPEAEVEETGSWENPQYPMLSCSPDGFTTTPNLNEKVLLEIKCLSHEHVDPAKFHETMTSEQCKSYYLKKNAGRRCGSEGEPCILLSSADVARYFGF